MRHKCPETRLEAPAHIRGITNHTSAALLELLGKPIEACSALVITTASYPLRQGPQLAWSFIAGEEPRTPMAELGWASVGVLELTALPSLPRTVWLPEVEEADALLVNGGDTIYLDRWMRESGLAASSRRSTWCTSASAPGAW